MLQWPEEGPDLENATVRENSSMACTTNNAQKVQVFLSHSIDDETISIEQSHCLRDAMRDVMGFQVEYKEYEDGGHWIHQAYGVDDMAAFIRRITSLQ
jgi:predicted esterase